MAGLPALEYTLVYFGGSQQVGQHVCSVLNGLLFTRLLVLTRLAMISVPSANLTPTAFPPWTSTSCTSAEVTTAPPAASTAGIMAAAMLLAPPAGTYAPADTATCRLHLLDAGECVQWWHMC